MAYNRNNLLINRGAFNQSASESVAVIHTYKSDDDTHAEITTAGYFPNYFSVETDRVKENDLLFVKDNTGDYLSYRLISVAPVSLIPENVSDNPFDQSLNTTNNVTFASTNLTSQITNPGGTNTLWINSFDNHLYRGAVDLENASGDVTGPASSTDNAFTRFDGTSGKVVQNSSATLDDTGNATFANRVNVGASTYFDDGVAIANNVVIQFDTQDFIGFNKATNTFFVQMAGAGTPEFQVSASGDFLTSGLDAITAANFQIGGTNATSIEIAPTLKLSSVANDDTETQFLVLDAISNNVEYRAYSSFDFIPTIGFSTDRAIARWDGAAGDGLFNTNVIIDDSDNMFLPSGATVEVDNIIEATLNNGVIVDGVTLKDNNVTGDTFTSTSFIDSSLAGGGTTVASIDNTGEVVRGSITLEQNYPVATNTTISGYTVDSVGASGTTTFDFVIPAVADTVTSIELIGWPSAGAAGSGKDIDLSSNYGAVGESISAHAETDTAITFNFGAVDTKFALNVSSVFTSIAAGDSCGLEITHNGVGGAVYYTHIRVTYTVN